MTSKQKKGTVGIEAVKGVLRLRLPRAIAPTSRYFSLGIPDTPINRQGAELRAKQIEIDIALNQFDQSLEKYKIAAIEDGPPLIELWDKYSAFKAKHLSHASIEKDFKRIRNHLVSLPAQRLTQARDIRSYLQRSLTIDSARRVFAQIKACCNWAVDEGLIKSNPFAAMRITATKKNGSKINPFTTSERAAIIKCFEKFPVYRYYAPFVKFLFWTGCRTSEAIGLQWHHISDDLTQITFSEAVVLGRRKSTKTNKTRRFPTNEKLRLLLQSIQSPKNKPHDLVFPSPKAGGPIDHHNFANRIWSPLLESQQIPHRSLYHTRHTFISHCLDQGVQVAQIAQWVGNSPRTIWQHYAGLVSSVQVPEL